MARSYGSFAELLSAGMREKGLDYRTLASLAGVSHTYLWQLAGGGNQAQGQGGRRPKRPSREVAIRIAEILGIGIQDALEAAGYAPLAELDARPAIVRYTHLRPDVPAIFQRGLEEARRGHPDRAVILLREAVSQGGVSFIRAHAGLGVAYMAMRDHDAAVREFTKVIDLFRQAPDGKTAKAASRSRDGVELADVFYNRGLAHQDSGRHRKAARDFRAAIAEGGPHPDLYYAALCFSELALGRFRRALTAALEFEANPGVASIFTTAALDVRLYQAYALARLGQFEAGLALSEAVGLLCPTYWYSCFVQGAILSRYLSKLTSAACRQTDRVAPARQAKIDALLDAAHRGLSRSIQLNPASRESIQAEREEDFAFLAQHPAFSEFFSPAPRLSEDREPEEIEEQDRDSEPDACAS